MTITVNEAFPLIKGPASRVLALLKAHKSSGPGKETPLAQAQISEFQTLLSAMAGVLRETDEAGCLQLWDYVLFPVVATLKTQGPRRVLRIVESALACVEALVQRCWVVQVRKDSMSFLHLFPLLGHLVQGEQQKAEAQTHSSDELLLAGVRCMGLLLDVPASDLGPSLCTPEFRPSLAQAATALLAAAKRTADASLSVQALQVLQHIPRLLGSTDARVLASLLPGIMSGVADIISSHSIARQSHAVTAEAIRCFAAFTLTAISDEATRDLWEKQEGKQGSGIALDRVVVSDQAVQASVEALRAQMNRSASTTPPPQDSPAPSPSQVPDYQVVKDPRLGEQRVPYCVRDIKWAQETGRRIAVVMARSFKTVPSHPRADVRLAVVTLCGQVLTTAWRFLGQHASNCIDALLHGYADSSPPVRTAVEDYIHQLASTHVEFTHFIAIRFEAFLLTLPRLVRSGTSSDVARLLWTLQGYLEALLPARVQVAQTLMSKLTRALLSIYEVNTPSIEVLAERSTLYTAPDFDDQVNDDPLHKIRGLLSRHVKVFAYFPGPDTLAAATAVCKTLASYTSLATHASPEDVLAAQTCFEMIRKVFLLEDMSHMSLTTVTGMAIYTGVLKGLLDGMKQGDSGEMWYQTFAGTLDDSLDVLIENLGFLCNNNNSSSSSSGGGGGGGGGGSSNQEQDNTGGNLSTQSLVTSLQCLTLEALALTATLSPQTFDLYLPRALYQVLELVGSSQYVVSQTAFAVLQQFAVIHRCSSAAQVITKNKDYVIDCVAERMARLHFYPQTPKVLRAVLSHVGADVLDILQDTLEYVLDALDQNQASYSARFFSLLTVIGQVISEGERLRRQGTQQQELSMPQPQRTLPGPKWSKDTVKELEAILARDRPHADPYAFIHNADDPDAAAAMGLGAGLGVVGAAAMEEPEGAGSGEVAPDGAVPDVPTRLGDDVDNDDEDNDDDDSVIPKSMYFDTAVAIMEKCTRFMTSRDKWLQHSVLETVVVLVPVVSVREKAFLPIAAQLWPGLMYQLQEYSTVTFTLCLDIISLLARYSGSFLTRRVQDELLPLLWRHLKSARQQVAAVLSDSPQVIQRHPAYKNQVRVLACLSDLARYTSSLRNRVFEVAGETWVYMESAYDHEEVGAAGDAAGADTSSAPTIRQAAETLLHDLVYVDPDALWEMVRIHEGKVAVPPISSPDVALQGKAGHINYHPFPAATLPDGKEGKEELRPCIQSLLEAIDAVEYPLFTW